MPTNPAESAWAQLASAYKLLDKASANLSDVGWLERSKKAEQMASAALELHNDVEGQLIKSGVKITHSKKSKPKKTRNEEEEPTL
jgi:hypothetical protein